MLYKFKYDQSQLALDIDQKRVLAEIKPAVVPILIDPVVEIHRSLNNPIGTAPLKEIARGKKKAVIVISDHTRPVKTELLLPPLLEHLDEAGLDSKQITIIVALGIHRPLTETELENLVGPRIYENYRVINHQPEATKNYGQTSAGTPLDLNPLYYEADLRICTGNIDLHFFAGYSGGAKAMMPGLSSRRAISNNHKMQLDPRSTSGNLDDNPVRRDIDQAGEIIGVDFILNLVQNEEKEIVAVCAGHFIQAHRQGCREVDRLCKVKIPARADLVIASAGGYPKDVNLYQAQKALDNAANAVKPGGTIILIAAAPEGYGEDTFEQWLLDAKKDPQQVLKRLTKEFVLGCHKAAAIARVAVKNKIIAVSEMDPELISLAFMEPAESLHQAWQEFDEEQDLSILVMPYAGYTLPYEEK